MNNLPAILNAYRDSIEINRATFLATVVQTNGSTYRKPGARMLIDCQGEMTGMVSGGCLEQDIFCHVQKQTPSDQSFVITYDTTTDEDILWGLGLGCDGVVQVLVEPLNADCLCNPLAFIADCFDRQQPGILATVFQATNCAGVSIGSRLMLSPNGKIKSTIENAELQRAIACDARAALQQKRTLHRQYGYSLEPVDVLLELIQPPPHLIVFGAGRDALPLAKFAKDLGWQLTVVDCRSIKTTPDRFSMADQIILTRSEVVTQQVAITAETIAVIMTHNYLDDLAILRWLLASSAQYIGVLGARQRTERLQWEAGVTASEQRHQLHAPVGLDIGAETPEEIAIAIVAEIQAVINQRAAGFLKHRQAPIHRPPTPHLIYAV
jgi:xanthine dehydrogenase accessory factor